MEYSKGAYSPVEAELAIRELLPIPVGEIGSEKWKNQREAIERLNVCSHSNAVEKVDDYVKSFLIEHEKLPTILHELLVTEAFRQRMLPEIMDEVAGSPTAAYFYCNYESVLVNLLECICFYEEVIMGFGDDIVELVDYCWRQVSRFFSDNSCKQVEAPLSADELNKETPLSHLKRQLNQAQVVRGMSCISILWFVVDRLKDLPMAVMNNILIKNDLLTGFSDLLLLQPWIRRGPSIQQKYQNSEFVAVEGDEGLRVCTPEAHAWFIVHYLLCDRECRTKYLYTQHKKERILRLRRFLNETLVDQIPALQSVQRALEELSFLEPPSGTEEKFRSTLVIEQVPRIISSIDTPNVSWKKEIERMKRLLNDRTEMGKDAARLSQLFDILFAKV